MIADRPSDGFEKHVVERENRKREETVHSLKTSRISSRLAGLSRFLLALGAVILVGLVIFASVPSYILPKPGAIGRALLEHRTLLLKHLWPTVLELIAGFVLGNFTAFASALAIFYIKAARRILLPGLILLRSVPVVALTPVLALWLGTGLAPRIAVVALITFFPLVVLMVRGLGAADSGIMDVMRVLNAREWQILLKLRIPASSPYVFSGLKIGAPAAVMGALVAEWLGSNEGIGYIMATATFEFRTELLWATIAVGSVLGVVAFALIELLQHLVAPWSRDGGH